jgi:hypothetical protein
MTALVHLRAGKRIRHAQHLEFFLKKKIKKKVSFVLSGINVSSV